MSCCSLLIQETNIGLSLGRFISQNKMHQFLGYLTGCTNPDCGPERYTKLKKLQMQFLSIYLLTAVSACLVFASDDNCSCSTDATAVAASVGFLLSETWFKLAGTLKVLRTLIFISVGIKQINK